MTARARGIKFLVWTAALAFTSGIAFLIFIVAGFGQGLGPYEWSEQIANALIALTIGVASQVGLMLLRL